MAAGRSSTARSAATAVALLIVVSGLALATTARGESAKSRTVTLSTSRATWMNTGIRLAKGQKLTLRVSGNGKCGAGTDCPAGDPFGSHHTCAGRTLGPLADGPAGPKVNYGAVAAKVGEHAKPFMVGHRKTVTGPGLLYVIYNDCAGYYADNSGRFTITAG